MSRREVKLDPAQTIPPKLPFWRSSGKKAGDLDFDDHQTKYLKKYSLRQKPSITAGLVDYIPWRVASKDPRKIHTSASRLFAMAAGEGISARTNRQATHLSPFWKARAKSPSTTIPSGSSEGQCIVMPAGHPHAVSAVDNFKMLLVVRFVFAA